MPTPSVCIRFSTTLDQRVTRTIESLIGKGENSGSPFDTLGLETQSMAVALNMPLEGSFVFEANAIGYSPPRFEDFVLAYCTRCQTRCASLAILLEEVLCSLTWVAIGGRVASDSHRD